MRNILLIFILAFLIISCKSKPPRQEKELITVTKTITELKRDTIIQVEADSSYYQALIECQNGKPVLMQNIAAGESKPGKNLKEPNVLLDQNGKLKITCQYLANQLKVTLKEKQILEQKLNEKIIIEPPRLVEKSLSWWQKLWITLGKILSAGLIIYIGIKIPWRALFRL
ncbi:MAG: hypothetical protein WCJ72_06485 [Chryseobacterium sp.]